MRPNADSDSRREFLQALTAVGGAGLGGGFLLSACAEQSPQDGSANESRSRNRALQQLNKIRREWAQAETNGDPSIIDKYGAEDLVHMPPGRPPVVGADAARKMMQKWFEAYEVEVNLNSKEIVVSGDLAIDYGTGYQRQVPKDGGESMEGNYSYLWVYRQESNGDWKQTHAIWNKNS